jgi:hypothetical protein
LFPVPVRAGWSDPDQHILSYSDKPCSDRSMGISGS